MKIFNSPKVGGGKTLIGENIKEISKKWLRGLLIIPGVPFPFLLMAFLSFYILSCSDAEHADSSLSQFAKPES